MKEAGNEGEDTVSEVDTFTTTLSELKRQGAALLVVGDVPRAVYHDLCQQMFGTRSSAPRRRILTLTDADPTTVIDTLPAVARPLHIEDVALVTYSTPVRKSVTHTPETQRIPTRHVDREAGLATLGVEISAVIQEFEQQAAGLEPAELRLGFDSLLPLFEEDSEQLFRFLHLLIGRIHEVNGMGHFHLPISYDSKRVRLLAPLFDAVVELRMKQGTLYQRWHLRESGVTTAWLVT